MRFFDRWINDDYCRRRGIRHRQTCPRCGRDLVNTYRCGDKWQCKRCWDKEAER